MAQVEGSPIPDYTVKLCAFCHHDNGAYYICPICSSRQDVWYIRESGIQLSCTVCHTTSQGPILDSDGECKYYIRPNTLIQIVHPITKIVEREYRLQGNQEILSCNVIIDHEYNKGKKFTVCTECRFIPSNVEWSDFPDVVAELIVANDKEQVIRKYYRLFPSLRCSMPPDERRGMLPETWLSKMRGYAVREMEKRLQSLHLPVHDGAAMIAEERLFSETLMSVNPELWKI